MKKKLHLSQTTKTRMRTRGAKGPKLFKGAGVTKRKVKHTAA